MLIKKEYLLIIVIIATILLIFLFVKIFYINPLSCASYSEYTKKNIDERIDKSCSRDEDCMIGTYYMCKPYALNKNNNLNEFYDTYINIPRPRYCPIAGCIDFSEKYDVNCENNVCILEQRI